MEIVTETTLVPQPPKEVKTYRVGERVFDSYLEAEEYKNKIKREKLLKGVPRRKQITSGPIYTWYYCKTLQHFYNIIGVLGVKSVNKSYLSKDFPQWIRLYDCGSDYFHLISESLNERREKVREEMKFLDEFNEMPQVKGE